MKKEDEAIDRLEQPLGPLKLYEELCWAIKVAYLNDPIYGVIIYGKDSLDKIHARDYDVYNLKKSARPLTIIKIKR